MCAQENGERVRLQWALDLGPGEVGDRFSDTAGWSSGPGGLGTGGGKGGREGIHGFVGFFSKTNSYLT
jgi:hypothetical protein